MQSDKLIKIVADMRAKRMTYRAICKVLKEEHGIVRDHGNLWRWWQHQIKLGRKLKGELEAVEALASTRQRNFKASDYIRSQQKPKPATGQEDAWSALAKADKSKLLD